MVVVPGTRVSTRELVWVDRQGKEDRLLAPPRNYSTASGEASFRVSPDGRKLVVNIDDAGSAGQSSGRALASPSQSALGNDIWVVDVLPSFLDSLVASPIDTTRYLEFEIEADDPFSGNSPSVSPVTTLQVLPTAACRADQVQRMGHAHSIS